MNKRTDDKDKNSNNRSSNRSSKNDVEKILSDIVAQGNLDNTKESLSDFDARMNKENTALGEKIKNLMNKVKATDNDEFLVCRKVNGGYKFTKIPKAPSSKLSRVIHIVLASVCIISVAVAAYLVFSNFGLV